MKAITCLEGTMGVGVLFDLSNVKNLNANKTFIFTKHWCYSYSFR